MGKLADKIVIILLIAAIITTMFVTTNFFWGVNIYDMDELYLANETKKVFDLFKALGLYIAFTFCFDVIFFSALQAYLKFKLVYKDIYISQIRSILLAFIWLFCANLLSFLFLFASVSYRIYLIPDPSYSSDSIILILTNLICISTALTILDLITITATKGIIKLIGKCISFITLNTKFSSGAKYS